jgi:hypothetical protein
MLNIATVSEFPFNKESNIIAKVYSKGNVNIMGKAHESRIAALITNTNPEGKR